MKKTTEELSSFEKAVKVAIAQAIDLNTSSFEEARERFERVIEFLAALDREGFKVEAKFDISLHISAPQPPPAPVLTCPYCGFSEPAPFERVDLRICAGCGRTVDGGAPI
jgi:hypothetical protein